MKRTRFGDRAGVTLLEVMVAFALFAGMGIILLELLSTGTRATAKVGETQMAVVQAARAVDGLLARGYDELARSPEGEALITGSVADGLQYVATTEVTELRPGLLRLEISLSWQSPSSATGAPPKPMELIRYLADPLHAPGTP